MSEHTPGPWISTGDRVVGPEPSDPVLICDCNQDGNWQPYGADAEANARLIAAAPDLLALLERIKKHLDGGGSIWPENGVHFTIKAAIKKAGE